MFKKKTSDLGHLLRGIIFFSKTIKLYFLVRPMPWPPGPPPIPPSAPYYHLCSFPFPSFYRNGRINRSKTLLSEATVAMTAAPPGSRWAGQMEVSHTSSPSHDAPTEGAGLSGAAVANLYIVLRCAGVFLKSNIGAKSGLLWELERRERRCCVSSFGREQKTILIIIIIIIIYLGREWVWTEDWTLRNSCREVVRWWH